jgi:hypothetical protein
MALPKQNVFNDRVSNSNIPFTFGKYFFVNSDTGSDGNNGLTPATPFASISKAYTQVTSGNHDVIVLSGNAAHVQTSMLDFSKSRFHVVSAANRDGSHGMGARSRITIGVTTAATDIAVMKNTGVGNTFTGLKFDSANTVDEGLYAVAEGGEYAIYRGCEFYKSTDLDETAAAEVLNNGDSTQWLKCVFGSTANTVADNKIRPNMLLTATLSGKKCRDNIIDDCTFLVKAGGTEAVRIYGANATDVERMFVVKNSRFINHILAAADPAHAVGLGATQTEGTVLLENCTSVLHTVLAEASKGIYVSGPVPTAATTGVAVTP